MTRIVESLIDPTGIVDNRDGGIVPCGGLGGNDKCFDAMPMFLRVPRSSVPWKGLRRRGRRAWGDGFRDTARCESVEDARSKEVVDR